MLLFSEETTSRTSTIGRRQQRASIYNEEEQQQATWKTPFKRNKTPSFLTIPHSPNTKPRLETAPRKTSSSSSTRSTIDKQDIGRAHTPSTGFRSASALSQASFRSLRSINSRIKLRIQSLGQAIETNHRKHQPKPSDLDWSALRAEYELHLARGSIIERCLVQVDLGPDVTERGRWWIDTVWTLADKLSPPLPAALAQYSANGLQPLLIPLRYTLDNLAIELPYDYREDTLDLHKFQELSLVLRRAIWIASLIENVIELVSQIGLIKFELIGLKKPFELLHLNDDDRHGNDYRLFDDHNGDGNDENQDQLELAVNLISNWSGEIRGKTGSNNPWKGTIKLS
ncbi:hypothetical protein PSTT_06630 [Puccinia striiformis]|uniref:Uncharacterized protein n=1 Tax=Puccinia striiformis TaxID=27350 RepID=A0A2S4VK97_9BASI|nr:hypothetical protein PSTT_06630 [Puccinia striiformis]